MGFLQEIVEEVRSDVARGDYRSEPLPIDRPRSPGGLRAALLRDASAGALLVEYKRASPGASPPELPSRSPLDFLAATRSAAVAGYSCITTRARFGGSVTDLATLARHTDRPVLFKDFVVDPRQIEAAARAGASAVLLIARLEAQGLLAASLEELSAAAHARGLEVLLELHAKSELRRAADVPADVYGVNVRDLDTLRLEREVAAETIRAAAHLRPLLGLSGVASPEDARRFWALGVDGILVGTSVARSSDPVALLGSLRAARTGVR
jgi:indole-3-glycerol phosphate synthase